MEKCLSTFKALSEASVDDKASVIVESSVLLKEPSVLRGPYSRLVRLEPAGMRTSAEELPHHTALWTCLWDISSTAN